MRRLVLLVAVAMTAVLVPGASSAGSGQPVCGSTVTGDVVLTADLTCSTEVGLVLSGAGTLDLGGHTIRGTSTARWTVGLEYENGSAFEVRDGKVTGWVAGLAGPGEFDLPDETVRVNRMVFTENRRAIGITQGTVEVAQSSFRRNDSAVSSFYGYIRVEDSVFVDNGNGVSADQGRAIIVRSTFSRNLRGASCSEGSLDIDDSRFTHNTTGIVNGYCNFTTVNGSSFLHNETAISSEYMSPDPVIGDNRFLHNGTAIFLESGGTIQDNEFRHNYRGIVWEYDVRFEAFELVVTGNHLSHNGDAIVVPTEALIGSNVAVRNRGWGINTPEAVDLGGNVAYRNGRQPQCVGVVCTRS